VSVIESIDGPAVARATFENTETGCKDLLKRISTLSKIKRGDWRFCGEHTGLYARRLAGYLARKSCLYGSKIRFKSKPVRALSAQKQTVSIRLSLHGTPDVISTKRYFTGPQKKK
jgi:hypothetical protein